MTIVIQPNELVSTIDPKTAQMIARCCNSEHGTDIDSLVDSLNSDSSTICAWLTLLEEDGYIKRISRQRKTLWKCTPHGISHLAAARIGKPTAYREAERTLKSIANRAIAYNSNDRFLLRVTKIKVSGLEKRSDGYLDDFDIYIECENRHGEGFDNDRRIDYLNEYGPERNLTIVDQIFYPEHEMQGILLNKLSKVHLFHSELTKEDSYPFEWHTLFALKKSHNPSNNHLDSNTNQPSSAPWIVDTSFLDTYSWAIAVAQLRKIDLSDIAEYWSYKFAVSTPDTLAIECWCCGSTNNLQRCHIIPKSLGGSNTPSNYVILCSRCHAEAPNIADPSIIWDWIIAHREEANPDYWTLADANEYIYMYGYDPRKMANWLEKRFPSAATSKQALNFDLRIRRILVEKASFHFGQSTANKATMAGAFRLTLKEMCSDYSDMSFEEMERLYIEHEDRIHSHLE